MKTLKRAYLVILGCLVIMNAAGHGWGRDKDRPPKVAGSGDITTTERQAAPFTGIHYSGSGVLRLHREDAGEGSKEKEEKEGKAAKGEKGKKEKIRVTIATDSNLVDYVETQTRGKTLYIGVKNDIDDYGFTTLDIDVYAPDLDKLRQLVLAGPGHLELVDTPKVASLGVDMTGTGSLSGSVECDGAVRAHLSGVGTWKLAGKAKSLDLRMEGVGEFWGSGFDADSVSVRLGGIGSAWLGETGTLKVDLTGVGNLYYRGSPSLTQDKTGLGQIIKEE